MPLTKQGSNQLITLLRNSIKYERLFDCWLKWCQEEINRAQYRRVVPPQQSHPIENIINTLRKSLTECAATLLIEKYDKALSLFIAKGYPAQEEPAFLQTLRSTPLIKKLMAEWDQSALDALVVSPYEFLMREHVTDDFERQCSIDISQDKYTSNFTFVLRLQEYEFIDKEFSDYRKEVLELPSSMPERPLLLQKLGLTVQGGEYPNGRSKQSFGSRISQYKQYLTQHGRQEGGEYFTRRPKHFLFGEGALLRCTIEANTLTEVYEEYKTYLSGKTLGIPNIKTLFDEIRFYFQEALWPYEMLVARNDSARSLEGLTSAYSEKFEQLDTRLHYFQRKFFNSIEEKIVNFIPLEMEKLRAPERVNVISSDSLKKIVAGYEQEIAAHRKKRRSFRLGKRYEAALKQCQLGQKPSETFWDPKPQESASLSLYVLALMYELYATNVLVDKRCLSESQDKYDKRCIELLSNHFRQINLNGMYDLFVRGGSNRRLNPMYRHQLAIFLKTSHAALFFEGLSHRRYHHRYLYSELEQRFPEVCFGLKQLFLLQQELYAKPIRYVAPKNTVVAFSEVRSIMKRANLPLSKVQVDALHMKIDKLSAYIRQEIAACCNFLTRGKVTGVIDLAEEHAKKVALISKLSRSTGLTSLASWQAELKAKNMQALQSELCRLYEEQLERLKTAKLRCGSVASCTAIPLSWFKNVEIRTFLSTHKVVLWRMMSSGVTREQVAEFDQSTLIAFQRKAFSAGWLAERPKNFWTDVPSSGIQLQEEDSSGIQLPEEEGRHVVSKTFLAHLHQTYDTDVKWDYSDVETSFEVASKVQPGSQWKAQVNSPSVRAQLNLIMEIFKEAPSNITLFGDNVFLLQFMFAAAEFSGLEADIDPKAAMTQAELENGEITRYFRRAIQQNDNARYDILHELKEKQVSVSTQFSL